MIFVSTGKLCSANIEEYITEEEGLDVISDSHSLDNLPISSVNWIKTMVRRNTQVGPEGIVLYFILLFCGLMSFLVHMRRGMEADR